MIKSEEASHKGALDRRSVFGRIRHDRYDYQSMQTLGKRDPKEKEEFNTR